MRKRTISRPMGLVLLLPLAAAVTLPVLMTQVRAAVAVNEPPVAPHSILVFPQRSFVSASGYANGDQVKVEVIHPSGVVVSATKIVGLDGLVEVNHPGGVCWDIVTPDIRPGDKVRLTILNNLAATPDQTTVANVTTQRAVQVGSNILVHGTAQTALGAPLPLAQLEQRLVIPKDRFDRSGSRTLRAPRHGTLAYDAPGSINWTATYTGLNAADITRALSADSRILWLGANPAAGVEATIYEVGDGVFKGPAAPCTAPLEVLPPPPGSDAIPPSIPLGLRAAVTNGSTVTLNWQASTDNVGVAAYGVYRDGLLVGGSSTTSYADVNVPPGAHTYTVDAADAVGNRSAQSAPIAVTTALQPAPFGAVNDPPLLPRSLIAFPSRDFVSNSGFLATDKVAVYVIRNGFIVSTSSNLVPQDDPGTPGFDGIVEVNHPGGGCWEGITPNLRPGDIVRTVTSAGVMDQTTVSNVTAQRPVLVGADIVVRGTAMDANGNPIPIDQLEQRLVSGKDRFDVNGGRRVLSAVAGGGGDGTLAYDTVNNPTGVNWTATFRGLGSADITRALAAESRILWLGRDPLAGVELTIFENADGIVNGPAAPCTAPAEPADILPPSVPVLSAVLSGKNVLLSWTLSTDNVAVTGYGVYRDGVRIRNVGSLATSYADVNVLPGPHTYAVDATDSSMNRSPLSNPVAIAVPDTTPPTQPSGLVAVVTGPGTVQLSWKASTDDVGVRGYQVYRNGIAIAGAGVAAPAFTDSGLAPGTYTYTVDAFDAANNRSLPSAPASATVSATADITRPTAPANLTATVANLKDVTLAWTAATDNVGVTGYGVYRRPVGTATWQRIANLGAVVTFTDAGVASGTYEYAVDAADSAGNRSALSNIVTAITVNAPPALPHSIVAFPQRDFVSASGFLASEGPVVVSLIRNGVVVSKSTPITPLDDPGTPGFDGIVEVNHPGGGCWLNVTPNIRPGDVVRTTTVAGVSDQTAVANVTALRAVQTGPGTVVVHGTAQALDGSPLPLAQLEQRLVGGKTLFSNGKRTLRTGVGGTLAFDPGSLFNWTATYTGLTATDVLIALAAESRILWLGADPLAGNELTIFENGPGVVGGPAAPCTAPAELP